jgi:eukaryotic-like serine/threonine-protein kinase
VKDVNWGEVKALFSAALQVPVADREALLTLEAGGNPALIAEVRSLLEAHDKPGAFLETVTHEFRSQAFAASSSANARLGERIGAYRIVGVLGSGGMGDVFKAVRDDAQYHAEVAIKLMRADVRSSLTEQRFRTERQILAGLDHRNIARLLDGGTADGGMPYVVMELVAGEPIDGWCDSRELPVRERVRLFLQVCAAVSYAHQHLIVHRDLKPNNILVTADGSVKLLDFGIAKLLEADADTAVVEANATATTLRAMTLEYASPEQVSGGVVTTVSDVYSLGVVLYRLLTGKSPYGVRTTDAQRMQEILSDSAPTRPSQVQRSVDGDLDNILLMALRKEPQRRYGSVEQLANDLRNYLSGMPVHARGNSLGYRTGKFVRRRKIEIAAGVLVSCSLIGAVIVSMREARIAEQERQIAQRHFGSVRKLANTLLFQLHDEIEKVPGSIKTREMLVKTSLEYLDTLYKGAGSDSELRQELATAYIRVANIQGGETSSSTGDYKGAIESHGRAISLLEPMVDAKLGNPKAASLLSNAYVLRARLMLVVSSPKEALVMVRKGVALAEGLAQKMAGSTELAQRTANAYSAEADILFALDQPALALAALEKVIVVAEADWRAHPDSPSSLLMLSMAYNNTAIHADLRLPEAAQRERAIQLLRKSLSMDDQLYALDPTEDNQRRRAVANYNLGRHLLSVGQAAEALKYYRLAAPAAAQTAADPNDAQAHYMSALVHTGMAQAMFQVGEFDEARAIYRRCAAVLERLTREGNTLRIEYAFGQNAVRLAETYAREAALPGASAAKRESAWRQARDLYKQGLASLHKVTSAVTIEPMDYDVVNDGVAGLALAEAALRN